ncbi:HMA2 domain-containing protein [Scytonema sp. NUACC26]|uniref:HMA2 domain-containing protein n=1 Tax=Scytonema sp. NUACC26 TaxID=3140176 RepID=UPI0034DBED3F
MTKTISSRKRLSLGLQKSDGLVSSHLKGDEVNKETKQSGAQSTGQPSLGELYIIYATSGRIRVRAIDGGDNSKLDTICQSLHRRDGIEEVYVNEQTGSLVINFDEQRLSLSQMLELLQSFGVKQRSLSHSESKTDPFAAWKSPDFWKEQGISFIPLFAGLAVTRRLGIVGIAAFPVYFITANATRRVISYLESQFSAAEKNSSNDGDKDSAVKLNKPDQSLLSKVEQTSIGTAALSAKITYNVVHAIPGRIRFNVPRVARDRAYAKRLERLLKTDSHVTTVRVNSDAASVAITYTSQIPVSHWANLMQLADETIPQTPSVKTPIEQQLPEPEENQSIQSILSIRTNEERVLEDAGLWSDYKTPALSTALSFMANFPLDMVS